MPAIWDIYQIQYDGLDANCSWYVSTKGKETWTQSLLVNDIKQSQ